MPQQTKPALFFLACFLLMFPYRENISQGAQMERKMFPVQL